MWKVISESIHKYSTTWMALSSLTIFLLFTMLVLPGQAAKDGEDASDAGSPDLSIYYTAGDLYHMAEVYGEIGRQNYVKTRFSFDLVWPLIYTLFLCTGVSWLFRRGFSQGTLWQQANLVPLWGMLFDFTENIATSVVMLRYPSPTAVLDLLAGIFTLVKWIFVSGSFALLLVGVVASLIRWIGKYQSR